VLLGEAASFINSIQFLEDWSGRDVTLIGSVVVMNVRRYGAPFLLEATKTVGRSPFGWMLPPSMVSGSEAGRGNRWIQQWDSYFGGPPIVQAAYTGGLGAVYRPPSRRRLIYNYDFLTKEGTPPEIPFGIKVIGIGDWLDMVR